MKTDELRAIAESVWNHGMPPVRKTPEQVIDFAADREGRAGGVS